MHAVVKASVRAVAATRGASATGPAVRVLPARPPTSRGDRARVRRCAGPRCDPFSYAGRAERRLAHRESGEDLDGSGGIAQGQRPASPSAGGSSARTELKPPWTSAASAPSLRAPPPSGPRRSPSDPAEIDPHAALSSRARGSHPGRTRGTAAPCKSGCRTRRRSVRTCGARGRGTPASTGDLCAPAPAKWLTRAMSLLGRNRLSSRSRRSASRKPPAPPVPHTGVGVHGVHLVGGSHRLVREPAEVAELVRALDREAAVRFGPPGVRRMPVGGFRHVIVVPCR